MTAKRTLFTLFGLALLGAVALAGLGLALGSSGDGIHVVVDDQELALSHLGTGHELLGLAIAACVLGIVLPLALVLGVVLPLAVVAGAVLLVGALLLGAGALALAPLWLPLLLVLWLWRRSRRRAAGAGATMAP